MILCKAMYACILPLSAINFPLSLRQLSRVTKVKLDLFCRPCCMRWIRNAFQTIASKLMDSRMFSLVRLNSVSSFVSASYEKSALV